MIHTDKWPVVVTPDGVVHFNWPLIQQHAEVWNSTDADVSSIAYVLMYLRKENNTLTAEIDRLRVAESLADWADWAKGEMERLRNELKTQTETVQYLISERTADRKHWGAIEDSLDRAERILAALREPSSAVVDAVYDMDLMIGWQTHKNIIRAAVAAAEQEVGRE